MPAYVGEVTFDALTGEKDLALQSQIVRQAAWCRHHAVIMPTARAVNSRTHTPVHIGISIIRCTETVTGT